jgi:1-pyrroline-5-carboxylate dehydrogenase
MFVASNLWPELRTRLQDEIATIRVGDVSDFSSFMGAVIDESAFRKHEGALAEAGAHPDIDVLAGGSVHGEQGWFVEPSLLETRDPTVRHMTEELFGPILTVYVYDERRWTETLRLIDDGSPYGLTGAVFSTEPAAIEEAARELRYAAGNFYVNDKPTGAVVGQQPFGGARASGTNDKAGSLWNLIRWTSPRAIKQTAEPARDYRYPFMTPDA